ncbi:MAG TPA: SCO family protein [Chthoniobacter sp.]
MSARRLSFAVLGLALALAGCGKRDTAEILQPPGTPATLQKYWPVPEFTLTESNGQTLHRGDLAGKVWVAEFFYTSCPGPCPVLTSKVGEVQKALGANAEVRLVSISVDPEKDTPEVLKTYAKRYDAGPNWLFCTGDKAGIVALAHDGFKLPIAEGTAESGPITHTTRLALVDKAGTVRGFYDGISEDGVQALVHDAGQLLEGK